MAAAQIQQMMGSGGGGGGGGGGSNQPKANELGVQLGPSNNFVKLNEDPQLLSLKRQVAKNLMRGYVANKKEGWAGTDPEKAVNEGGPRRDIKFQPLTIYKHNQLGKAMNTKMSSVLNQKGLKNMLMRTRLAKSAGKFINQRNLDRDNKYIASFGNNITKRSAANRVRKSKTKLLDISY